MESHYIREIKSLIVSKNNFGINEVRNLNYLKGLNYDEKSYASIANTIMLKKIEDILLLQQDEPKTFEDLTVFSFNDQNNNLYIVSIYDSDELWQNPVVLDIFPQ